MVAGEQHTGLSSRAGRRSISIGMTINRDVLLSSLL